MFPIIPFDEPLPDHNWRCLKIPPGTDSRGWVVGPIVCVEVHFNGEVSKPCRHAMSGGQLFCNCTERKLSKRKIGYLPFLNQHGERVVHILSNGVAKEVQKLGHGAPIKLYRPNTQKAPLKVTVWPNYECGEEKTKRVRAGAASDIQSWLLRLWQDDVLTAHFNSSGANQQREVTSVTITTTVQLPLATGNAATDNEPLPKPSLINPRRKRQGTA